MTDLDKLKAWDAGFKAYFEGMPQKNVPDYPEADLRDEWNVGWISARDADERGD